MECAALEEQYGQRETALQNELIGLHQQMEALTASHEAALTQQRDEHAAQSDLASKELSKRSSLARMVIQEKEEELRLAQAKIRELAAEIQSGAPGERKIMALAEAHRVLKFGGRFFCLEFSTTQWPGFRDVYEAYSHKLVPRIGKAIAGDEESYRYLVESISRFPPMPQFQSMIGGAGFAQTGVEPILGGLVAIHSGWKV